MDTQTTTSPLLEALLSSLKGLRTLLSDEKEILIKRNYTKLPVITSTKLKLLDKIEIENKNYRQWMQQNAESIITQHNHTQIKDREAVEELLIICKKQNTVNGIILSNNQRTIKNTLSILQGKSTDVLTYGASGESVTNNFSSSAIIA